MDRNLNEIQAEFDALVPYGAQLRPLRRSKIGKQDLILSIQDYFIAKYNAEGSLLPGMAWVARNIESPMLAQRENYLRPEEFNSVMESPEYCADVKLDGVRILMFYSPETGLELFSRNRSVTDYCLASYTDQIDGLTRAQTVGLWKKSFCLDGELTSVNPTVNGRIATDTILNAVTTLLSLNQADSWVAQREGNYPLRYNAFDLLMFDGKSLMNHTLRSRLKALENLLPALVSKFLPEDPRHGWIIPVPRVFGGKDVKEAFYNALTTDGGEGIILKDLNSTYRAEEARGRADWIKKKRTVSESMGSDIDAFVSGFELGTPGSEWENLVGSLEFSVYLMPSGVIHPIANCSSIPMEMRQRITVMGTEGKPTLDPAMLGKVATIDGQDASARARRFTHARITLWREDGKLPYQCTLDEAWLNSLVL